MGSINRGRQDPLEGLEVALLRPSDELLFRIGLHNLTLNTGAVRQKCFSPLARKGTCRGVGKPEGARESPWSRSGVALKANRVSRGRLRGVQVELRCRGVAGGLRAHKSRFGSGSQRPIS